MIIKEVGLFWGHSEQTDLFMNFLLHSHFLLPSILIVTALTGCRQDSQATISLRINDIGDQVFEFSEFPVSGRQIIVVFQMNDGFASWEDALSIVDRISIKAIFGNKDGVFQELTLAPEISDSAGILRNQRRDGTFDVGWRIILEMDEISNLKWIVEDNNSLLNFPLNLKVSRSK